MLTIRESDGRVIVTMIGLGVGVWYGRFGKAEGRTADPSTALRSGRDDKGEGGAFSKDWLAEDGTAGLSAPPNAVGKHFQERSVEQQVPPLRSPGFPVELGGVGALHAPFPYRKAHTLPCPVQRGRKYGYASVGMTLPLVLYRSKGRMPTNGGVTLS